MAEENNELEIVADLGEEGAEIVAADEEKPQNEDSLTFSNGVIEKIIAIAVREVPGVVGMKGGWMNALQESFGARDIRKGVTVEVTPEGAVRVNITILMEYGNYAPKVFEDIKNTVIEQVSGMTGLDVAGVNLRIEDILTADEVAARTAQRRGNEEPAAELPATEEAAEE